MTHPALALQAEVYAQLIEHAPLVTLLGDEFIYDDVPPKKKPPYIVFGDATHNDWSTGSETGIEHFIALNVWSRQNGRKEVLQISDAIASALVDVNSEIDGNHLINLTHELTEVRRDEETAYFTATVTFRAVTEPITTN